MAARLQFPAHTDWSVLTTNIVLTLFYYIFLTFCYFTDPSDRHATGRLCYISSFDQLYKVFQHALYKR